MPTYEDDPVVSLSSDLPAIQAEATAHHVTMRSKGSTKATVSGLWPAEHGEGVHGRGRSFGLRGWATAEGGVGVGAE